METDVRMLRSSSIRAIVGIDASRHVAAPRARHFATKPARGGETVTTIAAKLRDPSNNDDFSSAWSAGRAWPAILVPIVLAQLSRAAVYGPARLARACRTKTSPVCARSLLVA